MESHVSEAFRTADALAFDRLIDAAILIRAGVIVSRKSKGASPAFGKLRALFAISDLIPPTEPSSTASLAGLPFAPGLANAFSIARKFFLESLIIRGRDYVTFALLSGDPSLLDLAKHVSSSLERLQDEWFRFVTASDFHRSAEEWTRWWRRAGVPLPNERSTGQKTTGTAASHTTLLLTWNPNRFPFSKLEATAREVRERGEAVYGWNTGQRRANVAVGDRVFLLRQVQEPKGLVGSGWVQEPPREMPHWDEEERAKGKKSYQAAVRWDVLGEEPLLPLTELIDRTGEEKLWKARSGGRDFTPELARRLESFWKEARDRAPGTPKALDRSIAPVAWVHSDAIPVFGGPTDYRPSEHDSLDATTQAKIFATLLIAKEVRPPFALGLLGDWGVGKTFFMRLMQENVAAVTGKGAPVDPASESVSRAAQIEFNAWHYVDSDLWASLASHIFDGLSAELRGPRDEVGEIRRRLRRAIHSSQKEQEEARAAIAVAQGERQTATKELAQRQAARERVAADYASRRLERVWRAVLHVKPDQEKPGQQAWPDLTKLKDAAEKTARNLGISDAITGAEEAERVYRELRLLSRRGAGLTTSLAAALTGGRRWLAGMVFLLLLVLVFAWPWMLQQIEQSLELAASSLTEGPVKHVLQLATAIIATAAWAGKNLRSVSSAVAYLEEIRKEIRQPRLELEVATEGENELQRDLGRLDAEIAKEERRIEEADRQIAEAQAEIQRINAGGLVYDFLEGRVRDSRYLDRLGLISVIRNDFERLGGLLHYWRMYGKDASETETVDVSSDPRPIERIILYIDDLDRCPPRRVVEVLQAVHLILAFDLFVVVVAVDARWLERSLNEAYNPRTMERVGFVFDEPQHRFSAHNYLEKIFQIPFSLPAMSEGGYRQLVAALARQWPGTAMLDKGQETVVSEEAEDAPDEGRAEDSAIDSSKDEREQEQQEADPRLKEQEEAKRRIAAMNLREWEEGFISALFPFIRTPRLAKRFINIYRLLRVRASVVENDFSVFIDRDTGEYRAVLMLVALGVGHADEAPGILEDLHSFSGDSFREWLANARPDPFDQIRRDVDAVARALAKSGAPELDDRLEGYRKWSREVGRYSFQWHLRPGFQASGSIP
jgi:hypothetical protein